MDREQAKFILLSFRPDGQDAADSDFQEALQLAIEDRDLGEWLVGERAADAEFSAALHEIEIPDQLRLGLFAMIRGESPEESSRDEEMDQVLSAALEGVHPPEGLRKQILAAMEIEKQERGKSSPLKVVTGIYQDKKWLNIASIAAALAFGIFFAVQVDLSSGEPLASREVQMSTGSLLNADFKLDERGEDYTQLTLWLASNELPVPTISEELPPGLRSLKSIGCKEITLKGKNKASLICFRDDAGNILHLVIVDNQQITDHDLPSMSEVKLANCYHCPMTSWNVVRWQNDKRTYILMTKKQDDDKKELVSFF